MFGPTNTARGGIAAVAVAALLALVWSEGDAQRRRFSVPALSGPAHVECPVAPFESGARCRVDLATFIGARVYETHCARCHAADGLGSDFAPALPDRMAGMSRDQFFEILEQGYGGGTSAMPAWAENRDVSQYADALWVYLEARAAGVLPPGPLERILEPAAD